jgi:enamine deaminase RidA (YjgF/YER057c/UK114 family)
VRQSFPLRHADERAIWGKGCVARGTFAFLSGTEGIDPETLLVRRTMGEQVDLAWDKLKERLEEMGTSVENIVQKMTFVTDMDEWFRHGVWYQTRWLHRNCPQLLEHEPAGTLLGVPRLALPEMMVEIQVIAVVPDTEDNQ